MGHSGFISVLNALARESARQQRQAETQRRLAAREQVQLEREAARENRFHALSLKAVEKEAKQRRLEERLEEVQEQNDQVTTRLKEFSAVLPQTLTVDDTISFQSLRLPTEYPPFAPSAGIARPAAQPRKDDYVARAEKPEGLARFIPGAQGRYERALQEACEEFEFAKKAHERAESNRQAKLAELQKAYDQARESTLLKAAQRNHEVDELEAAYRKGDPATVVTYNSMVLERSDYPEGFPQQFRLAYVPESKELVIEHELPAPTIVPAVQEFRYVKTKDVVEEKLRKPAEMKQLYVEIVASVALRTLHEVFEADQGGHLDVVALNAFVHTVDPATGKDVRPCLISLRVTKTRFMELDLSRVDTRVCLKNLGAHVSQSPNEMLAVKPVVEFDMVDKRFVDQGDVLQDLESRPNLMDLNPFEFETLVANLFQQMGIESKLTRSSRDGGVDVVGFDKRPVLGGKVVIQAKRYRNTVGVSAVRDLYGTMMNEGANKGILVTTSGYGPDAFDFAKDKPIELIEGSGLLYLLGQIGVEARIIMPEESPSVSVS